MTAIRHDELYEALVRMHDGLDERRSMLANARLILLLCEQVGDEAVLRRLIAEARAGVAQTEGDGA